MLVNKWILFALSFIVAGINGAAWAGIGVSPGEAAGISTVITTLTSLAHLAMPPPSQGTIAPTGGAVITHT